jgi:transposase-like protein
LRPLTRIEGPYLNIGAQMKDQTKLAKEGICPICGQEMDYVEDVPSGMSDPYYECPDCSRKFDALSGKELKVRF